MFSKEGPAHCSHCFFFFFWGGGGCNEGPTLKQIKGIASEVVAEGRIRPGQRGPKYRIHSVRDEWRPDTPNPAFVCRAVEGYLGDCAFLLFFVLSCFRFLLGGGGAGRLGVSESNSVPESVYFAGVSESDFLFSDASK